MVGDNLIIGKKFSGDCAGFQTCQFLPSALALQGFPKEAKQRTSG
jgi:hypothetical protein